MTANNLYIKTMKFNLIKLGLSLATVFLSAIIIIILWKVFIVFDLYFLLYAFLGVGFAVIGIIRFLLMHYAGYIVKAGHIAVLTEAIQTGQVPEQSFAYAKEKVQNRFGTSNVFFGIDKLVAGSVKQIQRAVGKLGGFLDVVPGLGLIVTFINFFLELSLGYIDECCLGYVFLNEEQDPFKSAADGVVIYAQNWKKLLKDAAITTGIVVILLLVSIFVVLAALGSVFDTLGVGSEIAFIIAVGIAYSLKYAFVDSWILTRTMVSYMEVAPSTEITYDLYSKLCGLSDKFKELFNKGGNQAYTGEMAFAGAGGGSSAARAYEVEGLNRNKSETSAKFCKNCGNALAPHAKFCGRCGNAL